MLAKTYYKYRNNSECNKILEKDAKRGFDLLNNKRKHYGPDEIALQSCYFCYSCDFCDICDGGFQLASKILVTFAIFATFAHISGPFLASFFSSKS